VLAFSASQELMWRVVVALHLCSVREQNLSAIREGDLSFVAADGGDFHGGLPELRSV